MLSHWVAKYFASIYFFFLSLALLLLPLLYVGMFVCPLSLKYFGGKNWHSSERLLHKRAMFTDMVVIWGVLRNFRPAELYHSTPFIQCRLLTPPKKSHNIYDYRFLWHYWIGADLDIFFFLQYLINRESALERIIILLASNLQECREQILSFITTHHKLVALCTKLHEEIPLIDSQSFHDVWYSIS